MRGKKLAGLMFRLLPVGLLCLWFPAYTGAAIAPDADVAYLRKDCSEDGVAIPNCVTTAKEIMDWLIVRQPTAASPATVEIGPGQFSPGFSCNGVSNFSLKGSGRGKTIIGRSGQLAFQARNCFNVNVQHLTITGGFPAPVYWLESGSSNWLDVELRGALYGWSETACVGLTQRPVHRWFSSTIHATGKVAYNASCSENWFYGSEIIVEGNGAVGGIRGITTHGVDGGPAPETHVYGSVIRVLPAPGASFNTPSGSGDASGMVAVTAGLNAEVHVHGTGIDVIGNDVPNDIAALAVADGGTIHAAQSAFVMDTPMPGKIYRIKNDGGTVKAPFLWESSVLLKNLISESGADRTTEVIDGLPHPMVYTPACTTNGPWLDTLTGQCRQ